MKPLALAVFTQMPDDTERFRRMSPQERIALFLQLCDLTDAVQAGRPNRAALRAPTPMPPESATLWTLLMQRGGHAG